ncbi:MAG: leucine-rich repeat domain-containing protein [Oscillospiraceae bacterium]|nr:leucine-rich repeat domain-containing protein [Oscillospiraceae bacterium]
MKKSHKQALTLTLALIMLFATSFSSVTAVGADTPISLQSVPPNGETTTFLDVFPDPGLASAVAWELGKDVNSVVSANELKSLTYLSASNRNIKNTDGVQYLTGLTRLSLSYNQISNFSSFAGLTNLESLDLSRNHISDTTSLVSSLAGLTSLEGLDLSNNQISDFTPLAELTSLALLDLYNNQIRDISPLAELTGLEYLHLHYNQISDITPLAGLTGLEWLTLSANQISDISPLTGLTNLHSLLLASNQISDISPLAGLAGLERLGLDSNQISDISPLAGLTGLWGLGLSNQSITLDDTAINTPTAFTITNTNGTIIPINPGSNGTYENELLTWINTGDNQATWTSSVTIGNVTVLFSGTVTQYAYYPFTINDILATRDHILGTTPFPANERTMMDVNKDGVINIFDMLVMRQWILRRR